jgi:hypothetical protein
LSNFVATKYGQDKLIEHDFKKNRKKNHQIRSLEEGEKLVTSFNPRLKKKLLVRHEPVKKKNDLMNK